MPSTLELLRKLYEMTPEERAKLDYLREAEEKASEEWDKKRKKA